MKKKENHPPLGTLWIAATTLAHPDDIPQRSLDLIRNCPLLIFEEDKRARQFLKAAKVHRQWLRYTEQREVFTVEELERELRAGHDALYMSDQGTPGLADPGRDLVNLAYRIGARVGCIPGPSSLTAAISVCPLDCRRFQFAGFPPREEKERERFLRMYLTQQWPSVIFETPYRMRFFFETLAKVLSGSNRRVFAALDISGPNEQFIIGTADQILKTILNLTEKMNFVVILEGTGLEPTAKRESINPNNKRQQVTAGRTSKNRGRRFNPR